MIKRIFRSKSDIENLSRLRTIPPSGQNANYKKVVVKKPWGYEYLVYQNQHVAIWNLYLKYNHQTSMHCHPNKKTSMIPLSGRVILSTLEGWHKLKPAESVIIEEAAFHSSKAISKNGAIIMEIESPPNKKDLIRLKDEYGRENQEYEGKDHITHQISLYEYLDFHDNRETTKSIRGYHLSLGSSTNSPVQQKLKSESGHLICLLQGKLYDGNGQIILNTGEVAILPKVQEQSQIIAVSDIIYLIIS